MPKMLTLLQVRLLRVLVAIIRIKVRGLMVGTIAIIRIKVIEVSMEMDSMETEISNKVKEPKVANLLSHGWIPPRCTASLTIFLEEWPTRTNH